MKRRRFFMVTIALLFLPVLAQAHLVFFEAEVFLKPGQKALTDSEWRVKVEGINGLFGAPVELGGQDWSFEFPYIIPEGEFNLARAANIYLSRGDVDVAKYTAAAGEQICAQLSVIPPACLQLKKFYSVIGILGPGVPNDDEFPFEDLRPADCQNCGYKETHPTKAKRGEERPTAWGPEGAFPTLGYWYYFDWTTDVLQLWMEGPGNFYIVIYNPEGKPGDALAMWGWDECESHYNPADMHMHDYNAHIADGFNSTRIRCRPAESHEMGVGIPDAATE
ncbi:MAG: hypothetical protein JRF49_08525, partial [Deltaproteobacteria bacterium]|nr:hypothetical protein [Deltaproteobacteria bacterium]